MVTAVLEKPKVENRRELRRALRKALTPKPGCRYEKRHWPKWLEDRLTTLAVYSTANADSMPPDNLRCLQLYGLGWDYQSIGDCVGIKAHSVENNIANALDYIIDHIPFKLLGVIPTPPSVPKMFIGKGCTHCGGGLAWEIEDGEYNCTTCSTRFDVHLKPIRNDR